MERYHRTVKEEGWRPASASTEEEAIKVIEEYVRYYNEVRLHGAIRYVTPVDKIAGRAGAIFAERDRKLEEALGGLRL